MLVGSLFSGIGGLDLGLERAGMEVVWQVEIDEWCRRVLAKHWPDVPRYGDICEVTELEPVDLICGGFPCQPVSLAGKRKGQEDERWLWPEFARAIRLLRPRYVVAENVPGLFSGGFGDVLGDLAALGYDTEWDCIPAAAFGAPHLRYRVFIVAYTESERLAERVAAGARPPGNLEGLGKEELAYADGTPGNTTRRASQAIFGPETLERFRRCGSGAGDFWAIEPPVGRVAHGVPRRVDRLRGLGNAVVPQVAEYVGRRIMELDDAP